MKADVLNIIDEIQGCGKEILCMLREGDASAEEIQGRVIVFPEIIDALERLIPTQIFSGYEEFFLSFAEFCKKCVNKEFLIKNVADLDGALDVFIECIKILKEGYTQLVYVCPCCRAEIIYKTSEVTNVCLQCGAVNGSIDYKHEYETDLCKNGPLVSVVMSAYNHEDFVAEAIESVLNQTYKNIEFIVADDCSTDNTAEIMKRYSEYFTKAIYYGKNVGSRIKELLPLTTGKYIALMNSDDVWSPEKIELQVAYMEKHPECGVCFTWCDYVNETLEVISNKTFYQKNRSQEEWMKFFWDHGNVLCNPSSLARREYRLQTPRYGLGCWQLPDYFLWVDIIQQCEIFIIPQSLIKMRRYDKEKVTNVSASTKETKARATVEDGSSWINIIRDMDTGFFKKVFKDEMIYPDVDSEIQIKCEKYFVLLRNKNPFVQNSAFIYLYENLNEIQECLHEKYNYYKKQIKEDIMIKGLVPRIYN